MDSEQLSPLVESGAARPIRHKHENYYVEVPEWFEELFRPVDTKIIRFIQRPIRRGQKRVMATLRVLSVIGTLLTTIELGFILAPVLFLIGRDLGGMKVLYQMLSLSVLSQIPKRFLWRDRPWHAKNAVAVNRDKTSSFPSRAVSGAVVFGYFPRLVLGSEYERLSYAIMLVMIPFASFSRIYLGSHYPSDCIFGVIQGVYSVAAGVWLYNFVYTDVCDSRIYCSQDAGCIPQNMSHFDWGALAASFGVSTAVFVALVWERTKLWNKATHFASFVLSTASFQLTTMCGGSFSQYTIKKPDESFSSREVLMILGVFALNGIGWYSTKIKSISRKVAAFALIFIVLYTLLILDRIVLR